MTVMIPISIAKHTITNRQNGMYLSLLCNENRNNNNGDNDNDDDDDDDT